MDTPFIVAPRTDVTDAELAILEQRVQLAKLMQECETRLAEAGRAFGDALRSMVDVEAALDNVRLQAAIIDAMHDKPEALQ